jgi:hypothetical protein
MYVKEKLVWVLAGTLRVYVAVVEPTKVSWKIKETAVEAP